MSLTEKQRKLLEAASLFDFVGPPRHDRLPTGVARSLISPRSLLAPHRSGGFALTDEGRAALLRPSKPARVRVTEDDNEFEDHHK